MMIYTATTHSVRVDVQPQYLEAESQPQHEVWAWAYHVAIHNQGEHPVQLINRHWEITDGRGMKQVVDGPGIIGEQPVILPGGVHRYASWTWLHTPSGFMTGHYGMLDHQDVPFRAMIPAFSLDSPMMLKKAN